MAATTKTWTLDATAYVAVIAESYCTVISCYENARAATSNLYFKGAQSGSMECEKVAGEKVEFRGSYKPGDTVGYLKCVSAGTITIAQEEDSDR